MSRRLIAVLLLIIVGLVLTTGCSMNPADNPIDPDKNFWDKYFVYPLSVALDWIADFMWDSYGLSILVVTIIIRFIILPLTLKQYRSSRAMQKLQPEIKKLKEKFKEDSKQQQAEMMKLFQVHGVNPLAGCFPILVQLPILLALYSAIIRNPHIYEHTFLWMQLGERDTTLILPILAAATTFIQQKVMALQMTPQMQMLLVIFPILIFVISLNFPSALPLYWVYGNIFTIIQSYIIYGKDRAEQKAEKLQKLQGGKK